MKTFKWIRFSFVFVLLIVLVAAGCSRSDQSEDPGEDPGEEPSARESLSTEPVTLVMFGQWAEDYWRDSVASFVTAKYPHITLEYSLQAQGNTLEDRILAQNVPDIYFIPNYRQLGYFDELGIVLGLEPYIRKYSTDVSVFEDGLLDIIKANSANGTIDAFPFLTNPMVTYFNRDLFDRFNVNHPTDHMTWEEMANLARLIARTEDGVPIRGMDFGRHMIQSNQLSLSLYDPATDQVTVNTNEWQRFAQQLGRIFEIPGNEVALGEGNVTQQFLNRRLAILVNSSINSTLLNMDTQGEGFDWDLVTMPVFPEAPNANMQPNGIQLAISPQSKHPDQAYLVIEHMISDEVQRHGARLMRRPAIKDAGVTTEYGKGQWWDILQHKNIQAFLQQSPAEPSVVWEHENQLWSRANNRLNAYFNGQIDINTALREAEEEVRIRVEALKQQ